MLSCIPASTFQLKRRERERERERDTNDELDLGTQDPARHARRRIRCPLCAWEPDGRPYWQCERCLVMFDTFATHAHCPRCDNSWTWTQCIRCGEVSDHEAWYVDESARR